MASTHPSPPGRSAIRRGLHWWFSPPASPYVNLNAAVDFSAARDWLAGLRDSGVAVTVQHLVAAAVAQALRAWPEANARIVGRELIRLPHVGIGMPVNLLGHAAGEARELGAVIVEKAETLSVRDLGAATFRQVQEEREGRSANPMVRWLIRLLEASPPGAIEAGLDLFERARHRRFVADRFYAHAPVSTAISNVGAVIEGGGGLLFRAASLQLPVRFLHVTTLWGISPVQDEVVPVEGRPAVRPMLPFLLVFDHRVIDGVVAARLGRCFARILGDPAAVFGPTGERVPAEPVPR